jgi:hypothetical protein
MKEQIAVEVRRQPTIDTGASYTYGFAKPSKAVPAYTLPR